MRRAGVLAVLTIAAVAVAAAGAWWLRAIPLVPGGAVPDRQVLCQARQDRCRLTVLVRLAAAPFPYVPAADEDFWAGKDGNGRPFRRFRERRFPQRPHYADDRVLVHVTPHRPDGGAPVAVLYLHGHNADLRRDVIGRRELIRQVNASGRNIVLIAPQMAWRAIDSHPGKLGRDGGGARLIRAALAALNEGARPAGGALPGLPAGTGPPDMPVVVVAYSGGWRAAMWVALRGGLGQRLHGVVLLDAWFGPTAQWVTWKGDAGRDAFLVGLAGPRTAAAALQVESAFLRNGGAVAKRLPARLTRQTVLLETATAHARLPVAGPPKWPVAAVLRRLPAGGSAAAPDPATVR